MVKKMFTSTKLPNVSDMANNLSTGELKDLKYDYNSDNWFMYNNSTWDRMPEFLVEQLVFKTLFKIEGLEHKLTPEYSKRVLTSLRLLSGLDFKENSRIKGLIPFNNGILNLDTNELLEYNRDYKITYKLIVNYSPDEKLSETTINFLNHLTSDNPFTLQIIKAYLYLILTRNVRYQKALYIWGTGGSGKSTFENIIMAILGNKYVKSFTIRDINDNSSLSELVESVVTLFPDINYFKGDPTKLKNLISNDIIGARQLYKNKISFKPNNLVVITSNSLWQPNDSTTGLQRRIIYIKIDKIPSKVNSNLLNFENGQFYGLLYDNLPGLINWVLSTKPSDLELFDIDTIDINNKINPGINNEVNPLLDWVQNTLVYNSSNNIFIGHKKSDLKTLYPNYLEYCDKFGYTPISHVEFGNSVTQQLNLLYKDKDINKKRVTSGVLITNIGFKENQ